jgi:hypothetical protein
VPIRAQHNISILGSFFESALINFEPRLVEFVGQLRAPRSQPFRDQDLGGQTLEPRDESGVVHMHAHPPKASEISPIPIRDLQRLNGVILAVPPASEKFVGDHNPRSGFTPARYFSVTSGNSMNSHLFASVVHASRIVHTVRALAGRPLPLQAPRI